MWAALSARYSSASLAYSACISVQSAQAALADPVEQGLELRRGQELAAQVFPGALPRGCA